MSTVVVVVIVIIVILAIGAVGFMAVSQGRRKRLRQRSAPSTTVPSRATRAHARPSRSCSPARSVMTSWRSRTLDPEARERHLAEWHQVQERFVDAPESAVTEADRLLVLVMGERGYPTEGYEQQVTDLSVEHAGTIDRYRTAHDISTRAEAKQASTEDLRQAMVHYRALFTELLDDGDGHRRRAAETRRRAARGEHRAARRDEGDVRTVGPRGEASGRRETDAGREYAARPCGRRGRTRERAVAEAGADRDVSADGRVRATSRRREPRARPAPARPAGGRTPRQRRRGSVEMNEYNTHTRKTRTSAPTTGPWPGPAGPGATRTTARTTHGRPRGRATRASTSASTPMSRRDQRADDDTPGEDEPPRGRGVERRHGADDGSWAAGPAERSTPRTPSHGHDHVGEPFGTEEPMSSPSRTSRVTTTDRRGLAEDGDGRGENARSRAEPSVAVAGRGRRTGDTAGATGRAEP